MSRTEYSDIDALITKSFTDKLSQEEWGSLNAWLGKSSKNRRLYNELNQFWGTRYQEPKYINGPQMRDRIIQLGYTKTRSNSWSYIKWGYKMAAVFILLIVCVYLLQKQPSTRSVISDPQEILVEKSNPSGVKSRIILSDGSVVWLNAESKLKYTKQFSINERLIELEGEAFFEVSKDTARPFIVKAGNVYTQAIGTSFNIRNYSDENAIGVSLKSGKVSVKTKKKTVAEVFYLQPNQHLNISHDLMRITESEVNGGSIGLWKDNVLRFKNASFEYVIRSLERWYDVKIIYEDYDDHAWDYVGEFSNQSLEQVLDRIGYIQGFDFQIMENGIIRIFNKRHN